MGPESGARVASAVSDFKPATMVEPEPEPEITSEPEPEPASGPEPSYQDAVTLNEMLVPPFALMALLIFGMLMLTISRNWRRKHKRARYRNKISDTDKCDVILLSSLTVQQREDYSEEFLTSEEIESMEALRQHHNGPVSLFFMCLPAIISLALGPCLLLLRAPVIDSFWANGLPNINDGLGSFLAPAGLVYAITFGFTFQCVLDKQRCIAATLSTEVGLLEQILAMTSKMTSLTTEDRLKIYKLVKTEIISIMQQITGRRGTSSKDFLHEYSAGRIWDVIAILQKDARDTEHCDVIIVEKIISNLQELASCSTKRYMTLHYKVHPLLWMFLEILGFFSYFGVMLIVSESSRMDLTMCHMTVFSISLLCYVIGDLDHPFSGFFRINLSPLLHLVGKSEYFYREEQGKDSNCAQTLRSRSLSTATPIKRDSSSSPSFKSSQTL
ncbi:uncharacterized protein LOC121422952 [Lytechinus variegatus]|uniref:uncharacterized protein LOC121422952 n=1 Tax=Lytechinus variegatus TaxID=7654 RepID=UPI001BB1E9E3|nr:uncharacterized protein LOC121422952 [Lytechinus variegatus]